MKTWQLLADSAINSLPHEDLLSYMAWLEAYREEQQLQIAKKRATLQKLLARNLKNDEANISASEHRDIDDIRDSLLSS